MKDEELIKHCKDLDSKCEKCNKWEYCLEEFGPFKPALINFEELRKVMNII